MAHKLLINDWLSEFKAVENLPPSQLQPYAISIFNYPNLISEIFEVLEDSKYHEEYLEKVCDQLFKLYRSKQEKLRLFTFTFIPTLIGIHLTSYGSSVLHKKLHKCVDVLLLGIYNLEIVDEEGETIRRVLRLPSFSRPSIFHEPSMLASWQHSVLTENALLRLETAGGDITFTSFGPYQEYDVINCGNRMNTMTVLLKVYNQHLSCLPKQSYRALSQMAIKILRHGTRNSNRLIEQTSGDSGNHIESYSDLVSKRETKIPMSSGFLVELLSCIYFCMYNDSSAALGLQALEEIHNRAMTNLYTDALLMSLAVKNSLDIKPSGYSSDGPMGISVALSPISSSTSNVCGVAKAAITNASFRTKKLPDDIPIVTSASATSSIPQLSSINEENEEKPEKAVKSAGPNTKQTSGAAPKLPVLQLLKDRKEKKKDVSIPKTKPRNEINEVPKPATNDSGDAESDTSGVSEAKSSCCSDAEAIPLQIYPSNLKSFNEDQSNNSVNVKNSPLNSSDSKHNSALVNSEGNGKLSDDILCEGY